MKTNRYFSLFFDLYDIYLPFTFNLHFYPLEWQTEYGIHHQYNLIIWGFSNVHGGQLAYFTHRTRNLLDHAVVGCVLWIKDNFGQLCEVHRFFISQRVLWRMLFIQVCQGIVRLPSASACLDQARSLTVEATLLVCEAYFFYNNIDVRGNLPLV